MILNLFRAVFAPPVWQKAPSAGEKFGNSYNKRMTFVMTIPDEMRQKYIMRREKDLEALGNALSNSDFEVFFRVGHQLKGNAATFGYDSLGLLGEKLEVVGKSRDTNEAQACLATLKKWIDENRKV